MIGTMTLTQFLLERIAEDEARATWHHRLLCLRTACEVCGWDEGDDDQTIRRERVCSCGYPARILAECEAKRRIVAGFELAEEDYEAVPLDFEDGRLTYAARDLQVLASVYADHPDYREEWKP